MRYTLPVSRSASAQARITRRIRPALAGTLAFALALCALPSSPSPLSAQQPTPTAPRVSVAGEILQGRIVEVGTQRPVAQVEVVVGGRSTLSDSEGRYQLTLPAGSSEVTLRRMGFAPLTIQLALVGPVLELETRPLLLSTISVEGEGRAPLARGTSLAVETITTEQLHDHGHTSLAPALARAEGVTLSWTGSWGSRALLRGMGAERVAVLVDGNRVNRACVFGMDQGLATVDVAQVSRVEVLSGPGSTLFGTGNVGGVINVVTRRPDPDEALWGEARVSSGSAAPGVALGATVGAASDQIDFIASLDGARYGDYRTPARVVEGSGFEQLSGDAKLGWTPSFGQRVELGGQWYEGRDIGWPIAMGTAVIPEETRRSASLDWSWQRGGAVDALSARAWIQRLDHEMVMTMRMMGGGMGGMPGAMPMTSTTDATSHSTTSGGRVQARLLPMNGVFVDIGAEVTHLSAEATRWTETQGGMPRPELVLRSWPGVGILNTGVFGQGEMPVGSRVVLTGGVRGDHVNRTADGHASTREWVASGNLGARIALSDSWGVRTTFGRGFRLPDATELFGVALRPDGFIYRGNADLTTETGQSVELSLGWARGPFDASATLFRNELRDLIAPVASPGEMISGLPVRTYRNVNRAVYNGVSTSVSWEAGNHLTVAGQGAWTEGSDMASDLPLPGVPPLEGGVSARYHGIGTRMGWVELEGLGATRQDRNAEALREPSTPAWAVLNLRGGVELAGASVTLGVENLLDAAYRGHVDPSYTLLRPGRNLFVSLSRRF